MARSVAMRENGSTADVLLGRGDREAQDDGEQRLRDWERRVEWPLIALAVLFLATYAWEVLHVSKPRWLDLLLGAVLWSVWAVFAVDYFVKLQLARDKKRFVWSHLFDLLTVLLPMVRELRVLRLVTVIRVLNRKAASTMRGRIGVYVGAITFLICSCASLAVLDAERNSPDSTIQSFPDALWWTITTISTVGYGDKYPTTLEGRLVAVGLMIGGVALLGVITGTIASWFVERIEGAEDSIEAAVHSEVRGLRAELALLRRELAQERESSAPGISSSAPVGQPSAPAGHP